MLTRLRAKQIEALNANKVEDDQNITFDSKVVNKIIENNHSDNDDEDNSIADNSDLTLDDFLNQTYYGPGGFMSLENLFIQARERFPNINKNEVGKWIQNQKIYQEHKNYRDYEGPQPHFNVTMPNDTHQADILFMPTDNKFKYILTVIDVASRYKAAMPLKDKSALTVWLNLEYIYKNTKLNPPEVFMVDAGTEFSMCISKLREIYGTRISIGEKYNHKHTALVERFNRTLSERLFKAMEHRENKKVERNNYSNVVDEFGISYKKKNQSHLVDTKWVKDLQSYVSALNAEETRMIHMSPNNAIKLLYVPQPLDKASETDHVRFKIGDHVKYKLDKDETTDRNRRATDRTFSFHVYTIFDIVHNPYRPVYYFIHKKGPDGKFVAIKKGFKYNELLKI